MLLLGMDLETTGLDTTACDIIEIGAVLWDTDREGPLAIMNHLIDWDGEVEVSEFITELTGIHQADLAMGVGITGALQEFIDLADRADYIVAHNGTNFDRPILERDMAEYGMPWGASIRNWIDTSIDVPYDTRTRKLVHLAAEHGFVNPFAHRAFADVLTMLTILQQYDIGEVIRNSREPLLEIQAVTKKPWEDTAPDGEKETDKARARGYRWNGNRKLWLKNIRKCELAEEKEHGEFGVIVLEEKERL